MKQKYPKIIICQYTDSDDKKCDGSYFLSLVFADGYTFDFGVNSDIGELLGFSYGNYAMSCDAFYVYTGKIREYFFQYKYQAKNCKHQIESFVKSMPANDIEEMKSRFYKMLIEDTEKSKTNGYMRDYENSIKNMDYLKSLIENKSVGKWQ